MQLGFNSYFKENKFANRGMNLEDDINHSNTYYNTNGIALIYKKPTGKAKPCERAWSKFKFWVWSAITSCRPWDALHRTWSGTASGPARPGYPECRG